jgi:hypothetical protein
MSCPALTRSRGGSAVFPDVPELECLRSGSSVVCTRCRTSSKQPIFPYSIHQPPLSVEQDFKTRTCVLHEKRKSVCLLLSG